METGRERNTLPENAKLFGRQKSAAANGSQAWTATEGARDVVKPALASTPVRSNPLFMLANVLMAVSSGFLRTHETYVK